MASIVALVMSIEPEPWRTSNTPAQVAPEEPAPAESGQAEAPAPEKPKRKKLPGPWRIADAKGDGGFQVIDGKIGTDAFLRAVQDAGLEKKQAYRVLTALKDLKDLDKCDKTDRFVALVERASKRVKAFEYIVSKEEVYQAREGSDGLLTGKKLDLKVERAQVKVSFRVKGGKVTDSAEAAGLDAGVDDVLAKALEGHMNLEELESGDSVRIVAQEVTVLGEFSRYAGVEAVEVRSSDDKRAPLRVYYFRGAKTRGYFDARGRAPYEGGWRKPVKDAPVTSKFNPKRMHPVLKKVMPHTGTDFGAPAGTPVGASSFGTVSYVGYAGASGNLVKIEHPGGIETGYAHLSRFADGLKVGDKVKRLQVIGYVGSTGRSTGPHLHFTAKRNGEFFDAETLNLDGMRVLPSEDRDAFQKVKAKYDALLDGIALPPSLPVAAAPAAEEEDPGASGPDLDLQPTEVAAADPPKPAAQAPKPAAQPPPPAAAPAPKPARPSPGGGRSVYLTDKDLLELQKTTDDGEVDE